MEKITKITRPSGEENYKVLSSFKTGDNSYVILDSKLKDANQNNITFVCKENGNNLEYVDGNDWDQVKESLINIVKGNGNVTYIVPKNSYQASENIGHTLALKDTHIFELTNNYKLPENVIQNNVMVEEIKQELNNNGNMVSEPSLESNVSNQIVEPQSTLDNAIGAVNNMENTIGNITEPQYTNEEQPIISDGIYQQQSILNPSQPVEPVQNITDSSIALDQGQPIIQENNAVNIADYQSNYNMSQPLVNSSLAEVSADMSVEDIKNKIISLCDVLSEREKKLAEKEQIINAKLEVANKAFENAQAVNQMSGNTQNIQITEEPNQARNFVA